jgi:phosphinothricin acetyltransferase
MAIFSVHRATDRDLASLEPLCAEATGTRGALWSLRRDRFNPAAWITARAPVVVARDGTKVVGFAAALAENMPLGITRCAEALVYVTPAQRRKGAGRAAMAELMSAGRAMGLWKMIAYVWPEDGGARAMLAKLDFREVGTLVKHAQMDGGWRDIVLCERLVLAARKSVPSFSDA